MLQNQVTPSAQGTASTVPDAVAEKLAILQTFLLLKPVPPEALHALADAVTRIEHRVQPGSDNLLFKDGARSNTLYFVVSGAVEIFLTNAAHAAIPLETIYGGGIFGEVAVLQNTTRTASARVVQDMVALEVKREKLLPLLTVHPELMMALLQQATRRLGRTSRDIRKTTARNPGELFREAMTTGERRLHAIARFCGSVRMLAANAVFLAIWMAVCYTLGKDPFNGVLFNVLGLLIALEAVFITCIVLHSQNLREDHERFRDEETTRANRNTEILVIELSEKVDALTAELRRHPPDPTHTITQAPPHGSSQGQP